MATNFKIERVETKSNEPKEYVVERDNIHKEEMRRIAKIEAELKRHEKMPMKKAHPAR